MKANEKYFPVVLLIMLHKLYRVCQRNVPKGITRMTVQRLFCDVLVAVVVVISLNLEHFTGTNLKKRRKLLLITVKLTYLVAPQTGLARSWSRDHQVVAHI